MLETEFRIIFENKITLQRYKSFTYVPSKNVALFLPRLLIYGYFLQQSFSSPDCIIYKKILEDSLLARIPLEYKHDNTFPH